MGGKPKTALSEKPVVSAQGTIARRLPKLSPRIGLAIVAAGVFLVVGATSWFLKQNSNINQGSNSQSVNSAPVAVVSPDGPSVLPTDYTVMTPEQAAARLKQDTGLDLNKLKTQKLDAKTFTDFTQAYAAAQALFAVQAYDQSAAAYKLAADVAPNNVSYVFYLNYAEAVTSQKDMNLVLQLMNKAKSVLQADTSMNAAAKQDELEKIDQKIKALQRAGEGY